MARLARVYLQMKHIPIKIAEKRGKKALHFAKSCVIIIVAAKSAVYFGQKEVNKMKEGIHPKYEQTTIRCACGEVIETGSTKKDIRVEICSKCHPFFTGKQKLVDTSGRVDKFNKKFGLK